MLVKFIKGHYGFSDHSSSCKVLVIFALTSGTPVNMLQTFKYVYHAYEGFT
jgi:hypothetical protein